MICRYLFGPVSLAFAEQNLSRFRRAGHCLAFGPEGPDVSVGLGDSWAAVLERLPQGWQPDFVVLHLPYTTIPPAFWSAPLPILGLAADWQTQWSSYRRRLRALDMTLADPLGVQIMSQEGLHARSANLLGLSRDFAQWAVENGGAEGTKRQFDVLFVGNVHPAVTQKRLAWLGRLGRLAARYRVHIHRSVDGPVHRELLSRAKIVFNRSLCGECNRGAFEAAAAGALLFQEAGNRETPAFFRDREEFVSYTEENLEAFLEYYLEHDGERSRIAAAGRKRAAACTFENLWDQHLAAIEADWPAIQERFARRLHSAAPDALPARIWEALNGSQPADAALVNDLAAALVAAPMSATLHNAMGLAVTLSLQGQGRPWNFIAQQVVSYFQQAVNCDPQDVVAGLNLAEALVRLGKREAAVAQMRQTLKAVEGMGGLPAQLLDTPHFPPGYDHFRMAWEQAGWENAGRPQAEAKAKRDLVCCRLHTLLAELTGNTVHAFEATVARPDQPHPRVALARILNAAGQSAAAVPHLRWVLDDSPFDLDVAEDLFNALEKSSDGAGQRRLADERRLLSKAAAELVPMNPWLEKVPPVGDELASILILCCNELEYTRRCLESVLECTRTPFELVLVDNGSTDDTPCFVAEIQQRSEPKRVVVIRNETNRGFAAGCNQALAKARGRYLVFLNNDTVVTPAWLEGLIGCSLVDYPRVGMVGPVSNYAPAPQYVPAGYPDLGSLPFFAARRRHEFAGKAVQAERLTGFCLLVRREVFERIGGLDERFETGFFEDDDLCLRTRDAGFQLLVALNVYIHHFGKTRVSLTMIVRNEEENLPACLASAEGLFDEIVVVDTGSTDKTKEIGQRFGAKVADFPWVDNFAAARNESVRHATGDFIFWLDADDRLDAENRIKLQKLFENLNGDDVACSMKCLCLEGPGGKAATYVDHVRLFRNLPQIRWKYRVHEQILAAVRIAGDEIRPVDIVIQHVGYLDPALRLCKHERDLRLLHLELEEFPNDPFVLFNRTASPKWKRCPVA